MELLWADFSEEPPSVHERRPELPEAIDAVIAIALDKEPGERYASGRDLAAAAAQALGLRWMAKAREWDDQRETAASCCAAASSERRRHTWPRWVRDQSPP